MIRANATLKARIARLERRKTRRAFPKLVFALDAYQDVGEVTGYRLNNVTVIRLAGETAEQCANRAFSLQPGTPTAAALYGPQGAPELEQPASGDWGAPDPSDALSGPFPADCAHANPKRG
jgi:hypothetical protein